MNSGSSGAITLNPAFTSATSFTCTVSGANATISSDYRFQVTYTSGSSITITSTSITVRRLASFALATEPGLTAVRVMREVFGPPALVSDLSGSFR